MFGRSRQAVASCLLKSTRRAPSSYWCSRLCPLSAGCSRPCLRPCPLCSVPSTEQIFQNIRQEYSRYQRRRQLEGAFNQSEAACSSTDAPSSSLTAPSSPPGETLRERGTRVRTHGGGGQQLTKPHHHSHGVQCEHAAVIQTPNISATDVT